MPYLISSKVVAKLSLNEWHQNFSRSRQQMLSGSKFLKSLKKNGIFHTLWEQSMGKTWEFKSRKMAARFVIITNTHTFHYFNGYCRSWIWMFVRRCRFQRKSQRSGIWNKTSLLQGIQDGSFKLPKDEKLSNGEITPYVFLGDDVLRLTRLWWHDLMLFFTLRNDLYLFVLIFGLFRTFECQKRSKDTPSFMFFTQRSDKIQIVWWNSTQMHQTCKPGLMKEDLFDEKFAREQTSSNNVKHDLFLLF